MLAGMTFLAAVVSGFLVSERFLPDQMMERLLHIFRFE